MKNQPDTAFPHISLKPPQASLDAGKVYRSIIDVVCAIDGHGIFRFVSASGMELFGYAAEEMAGASFTAFIHPDDIEKTVQGAAGRAHDCRTSNFSNRYIRKDGATIAIIWSARWDAADQLFYCVARDGSEQREMEQRLIKAQQLAKVASFEFDILKGQYTHLSETFFQIFGLDPKTHPVFTSDLFWSLVHPEDAASVRNNLLLPEHLSISTIEYRIIRPNGEMAYISRRREVVRDAAGNHIKTIGTVQDITDSKISEIALQQREERFRSLVQNGNDMIGIIDEAGTYLFVSDNVTTHIGYTVDELVGKNAFSFIHPEDTEKVLASLQTYEGRDTVTFPPFRFRNKTGAWRWMEVTVTAHTTNPAIGGLVVNSRDITDKKAAEDERQRLSLIAKETNNPVIIQDGDRNVVWVNPAFTGLTGYSLEECIGRFIGEVCDGPKTSAATLHYVQEQIEKRQPFHIETINYKKSGEIYWSDVSCQPIFNEAGEVVQYFSIATDITERKRLEQRLRKEQHDRQVQISAATLKAQEYERSVVSQELHDNVNQVLTTVKLYTEMCRDGIGDTTGIMDKSIQLLQSSITEIRSLSKRLSAPSLGKIKLAESIKELSNAVGATNKFSIALDTRSIEALEVTQEVHLALYRILQEQLTNILKYAAATEVSLAADHIMGQITLTITDNGKGFDTEKKRTGIGITNMITRAESLGGTLFIESAPGSGCSLVVSIPV